MRTVSAATNPFKVRMPSDGGAVDQDEIVLAANRFQSAAEEPFPVRRIEKLHRGADESAIGGEKVQIFQLGAPQG